MEKIYIGTFTSGESKGIYYGSFSQGKISIEGHYYIENPSYLAKVQSCLYAVSETLDGEVFSFDVLVDGSLRQTGQKKVFGDGPCYVTVGEGRLYTANYSSGSISEFILEQNGSVNHPPKLIVHYGYGADKKRQNEPHVHQTILTPDHKHLAVCDLGIDAVCFYPIDAKGVHEEPQRLKTPAGMGPRHLCFGKEERWYLIGELTGELLYWQGYGKNARLIQKVEIFSDKQRQNDGGAIALSPEGDSLACSVRGEDTLVLFAIDEEGRLYNKSVYSTGGQWPRDVAFSPDGKYVLAALQHSGEVAVFSREKEKLHLIEKVSIPGAACICF